MSVFFTGLYYRLWQEWNCWHKLERLVFSETANKAGHSSCRSPELCPCSLILGKDFESLICVWCNELLCWRRVRMISLPHNRLCLLAVVRVSLFVLLCFTYFLVGCWFGGIFFLPVQNEKKFPGRNNNCLTEKNCILMLKITKILWKNLIAMLVRKLGQLYVSLLWFDLYCLIAAKFFGTFLGTSSVQSLLFSFILVFF